MNPERAAQLNLDKQNRGDVIKASANLLMPRHEKIAKAMEAVAIKPESFIDLYGEDTVNRDKSFVADRKKLFAQDDNAEFIAGLTNGEVRKLAEILEYQILRGINIGNWLPYCNAIKTSDYDDIANGMDLVVEFSKTEQVGHLGLGVDISFSHNLMAKFRRIKEEIDMYDGTVNKLGRVKYYNSERTHIRGELSGLPRVVAALDVGIIEDLTKVRKDEIHNHTARHTIIMEMETQLAVFADYADKNNPACLDNILRAQNLIHIISTNLESEAKLKDSEYQKNNRVQDAIEEGLSIFR